MLTPQAVLIGLGVALLVPGVLAFGRFLRFEAYFEAVDRLTFPLVAYSLTELNRRDAALVAGLVREHYERGESERATALDVLATLRIPVPEGALPA